jgi:hypothetical protein
MSLVRMLGHFQKKVATTMDEDSLVDDLVADALALSKVIPAGLLHDAFQRVLGKWGGGLERRPGVADFKKAVERELRNLEIEVSRLKTGLMRVQGERERQNRRRG